MTAATEAWKEGATLTHVYSVAGTFTPSVVALDEAGNSSKTAADPVTVTVDGVGPAVTIAKPKAAAKVRLVAHGQGHRQGRRSRHRLGRRPRHREARHDVVRLLRDDQEVDQGRNQGQGLEEGRRRGRCAWTRAAGRPRLSGLRKGKLLLRASAVDNVGNVSKLVARAAKLTS